MTDVIDIIGPVVSLFNKETIFYDPYVNNSLISKRVTEMGYTCYGSNMKDFPFYKKKSDGYDVIISAPIHKDITIFLKRCCELDKPFIIFYHMGLFDNKERFELLDKHKVQIIIPNCRTKSCLGETMLKQSLLFVKGLGLEKDINYLYIDKKNKLDINNYL